jgi:hypothetical protein
VLLFLLRFFLSCHGFYSPFPSFDGVCRNGKKLQLIECIELLKNDVKKKMMMKRAIVACTKVTEDHHSRFFARKIL